MIFTAGGGGGGGGGPCAVCTSLGSALGSTYSPHVVQISHTVKTIRLHVHVYTCETHGVSKNSIVLSLLL